MKTVTELIEIAEETFRSEDLRLENERREAEQRRKDAWNGRIKKLQDKLTGEEVFHKNKMTAADKAYSGNWAFLGLVAGYILGSFLFLLLGCKYWWEAAFWPIFILLLILGGVVYLLCLLIGSIFNGGNNCSGGVVDLDPIILATIGALFLTGVCAAACDALGFWLAKQKEARRHAERLEQIRTEGAWLKLSGFDLSGLTVDQMLEKLERAKIQ